MKKINPLKLFLKLPECCSASIFVPCVHEVEDGTAVYHVRVVPPPGSSRGDDGVLISSGPVHDGLDGTPRVEHVTAVAPVVARLADGCVVGLQATKVLVYVMQHTTAGFIVIQLITRLLYVFNYTLYDIWK